MFLKMSTEFVKDPNDVVKIGQKVKVRVAEIDDQGRINLSMLFGEDAENKEKEEASGESEKILDHEEAMSRRRSDHP